MMNSLMMILMMVIMAVIMALVSKYPPSHFLHKYACIAIFALHSITLSI